MIFIDELESLKLYKRPFYLPFDEKNKKKNSVVFLLTPSYKSSINVLNNPLIIKKYFRSYYIEKDITYYINQEGALVDQSSLDVLNEAVLQTLDNNKTKVVSQNNEKIKNKLKYQIKKRIGKYKDKANTIQKSNNISNPTVVQPKLSSMDQQKVTLSEPKLATNESYGILVESAEINDIIDDNIIPLSESQIYSLKNIEDNVVTENYMKCTVDNESFIVVFNEADIKHNSVLYKILYRERLKTNKQVWRIYDKIKQDVPYIKKTYIDISKYKSLNLFIDLYYYNKTFFKNNIYKLDKGVSLYFDFIDRFINTDKSLFDNNYRKRTVFVPLEDWYNPEIELFNHTKDINPISMIYRIVKTNPDKLQKWNGIDFVFLTSNGYFKVDLSELNKTNINRFRNNINKLLAKAEIEDNTSIESPKSIVTNIVDKIEKSQKVEIDNINGTETNDDFKIQSKGLTGETNTINKDQLVDKIKKAAAVSSNTDEALNNLDTDNKVKEIISKLADDEENSVKINAARASRINKLQQNFLNEKIKNMTVKDMIEKAQNDEELPVTELKIDTVNEQWKDLKYVNFEKIYNPNDDIVNILNCLSEKTEPVMVRKLNIEDTSTSEDYVYTYNVQMEDAHGSRFTIKFDIPKLIDNKFLKLRGNAKTISGQLINIPIIKTDEDVTQLVSNYNKIFIYRHGSGAGKSCECADKLIKTIRKVDKFKVQYGDNSRICSVYELPIDYVDLAAVYNTIENDSYIVYFNQDKIRELYNVDDKKGIPIIYDKTNKEIIYFNGSDFCSKFILSYLSSWKNKNLLNETVEAYKNASKSKRYMYSQASILNSRLPLILVMAYSVGLTKAMQTAKVKYKLCERKSDFGEDAIKFKDGYLCYILDYNSSLLMNGLKECNTEDYSLAEINSRSMYLDFLDIFGSRILADGLDNFYDLMIDPITKEVSERYKLPTDYIEQCAYANLLLSDNKYIIHTDMEGKRYRSNEIIAGYAYKAIADSYGAYRNELKRKGKATMTMKQSAVLDKILQDPTAGDVSILNDLCLLEAINTVSTKGLSGMNSDRSYSLDKRTFDKSMLNILGLSTGFAGNVGISRQATIDMNVESKRGYLKITNNPDNLNITKTFTATEALTPFGVTSDDPFRSAMTFIQTAKHGMRVTKGMPSLISNGMDQALPYLTPNVFSYKSSDKGKVIEKTEDYMIVEYANGNNDFIDLRPKIHKNSNGGFYIEVKLDTDMKVGQSFGKNHILAYDKSSYSNIIGDQDNISYILGTIAKVAILNTDEGYEDSAIISDWLSEAMASEPILKKEINLSKNTNIFNLVKKGQELQEGEPLLIFQNAFEDADVNILLKNLANSEEMVSQMGRIPIKCPVTGVVTNIEVARTVELDELSDSLRKVVNSIEKETRNMKKVMDKYNINKKYTLDPDYKLEPIGKMKNVQDGVKITIHIKYHDKMSVGDKLIYQSALKGVVKDIFPKGKEPYTDLRPNEKIHTLLACGSVNARMVCSVLKSVPLNKFLIELDRTVKDMAGIKWKPLDELV